MYRHFRCILSVAEGKEMWTVLTFFIVKFCMLRDVSVLWRLENKLLDNTYFFFGRGQKFCLFENHEEA